MIDKLNSHYSFTNPASVYDEEALTALELAGRTAAKVNEVVDDQNKLSKDTKDYIENMNNVVMPAKVVSEVQSHIDDGSFDRQIDESLGNLTERLNNLLGKTTQGSTTMDAEIIDARVGADGKLNTNLGEAVRNALTMGGLIEDTNYASKMPDANAVLTPNVYIMHFADGTTNLPANLPFTEWHGRIGLLLVFKGSYYRQIFINDNAIYTRNASRGDNWSEWRTLTKPEYIIDVNGGGDFASLVKALKAYPTNVRFIVKQGTYDVKAQFESVYGGSFFENYTGYAGQSDFMRRGLFLGDGVELIADGYVELLFDYTGANTHVKEKFAVLSTSQNNIVDGINITITDGSCRYIIHDDFATKGGSNVFRNLILKGHSNLSTAIGGGFGTDNQYMIDNCVFVDAQGGISIAYHNNVGDAKNILRITDCYCDGSIYLKHYGTSSQKSEAYVSGCECKRIELVHGDSHNYPNENITLVEWGNNLGSLNNKMDAPATAEVGQLILVKRVDANGKPVEFETVDRTHWVEPINLTTPVMDEKTFTTQNNLGYGGNVYMGFATGTTYIVAWNGVEYKCVCRQHTVSNETVIGGQGEPFTITNEKGSAWVTIVPTVEQFPMTVKIDRLDGVTEVVHKLDAKYLPDSTVTKESVEEAIEEAVQDVMDNMPVGGSGASNWSELSNKPFTVIEGNSIIVWDGNTLNIPNIAQTYFKVSDLILSMNQIIDTGYTEVFNIGNSIASYSLYAMQLFDGVVGLFAPDVETPFILFVEEKAVGVELMSGMIAPTSGMYCLDYLDRGTDTIIKIPTRIEKINFSCLPYEVPTKKWVLAAISGALIEE